MNFRLYMMPGRDEASAKESQICHVMESTGCDADTARAALVAAGWNYCPAVRNIEAAQDEQGRAEARRATIKPENWQALAGTVGEIFNGTAPDSIVSAIRAGRPSAAQLAQLVEHLRGTIHATYNGQVRALCKAFAQTLVSYGLLSRAAVADLLPAQ